jgi:hypothetical protein
VCAKKEKTVKNLHFLQLFDTIEIATVSRLVLDAVAGGTTQRRVYAFEVGMARRAWLKRVTF